MNQITDMLNDLKACAWQFATHFQRLPNQSEAEILWAAVQRHYGVPEWAIEPASQRRQ